jgi:formate hydrogenlyase transcriptional activator
MKGLKVKENQRESELRRSAEEKLKEVTSGMGDLSEVPPENMADLIHELQVHQIELKMQNEELRRTQEELEKGRDQYSHLYDFSPVGYVTLTEKGIIHEANLTLASMLGVERGVLVGKFFSSFVFRDDQDAFYKLRHRLLETDESQSCELRLLKKNEQAFFAGLDCVVVKNRDDDFRFIRAAVSDITERHLITEALREAHDGLEQRVEERTAELRTANAELAREIEKHRKSEETLRKALSEIEKLKEQLEAENIYFRREVKIKHQFNQILGQSDSLRHVLFRAEQVAPQNTTVLILGETGTGKELVAAAIHNMSPRKDRPLITVNCAALPANLIESELFGREKGAFTGADTRQIGRFEIAHGSTLCLDEIGELPLDLQVKLLRVIQHNEFERLGSSRTIKVDVRVLATTNRNLEEEVQKGRFRQDLYYRLNVFPITVPPLRQRKEDIPLLVHAFIERYARKMGKKITSVQKGTMKVLQNYRWPGNIRELESTIERAVILCPGPVFHLADELAISSFSAPSGMKTLEETERNQIFNILLETGWRIEGKKGAAEVLGLHPSTLRARMHKLGIVRPKAKAPD